MGKNSNWLAKSGSVLTSLGQMQQRKPGTPDSAGSQDSAALRRLSGYQKLPLVLTTTPRSRQVGRSKQADGFLPSHARKKTGGVNKPYFPVATRLPSTAGNTMPRSLLALDSGGFRACLKGSFSPVLGSLFAAVPTSLSAPRQTQRPRKNTHSKTSGWTCMHIYTHMYYYMIVKIRVISAVH